MRHLTAAQVVRAYEAWRSARPGSSQAREAKLELDEEIGKAQREDTIERAHVRLDLPFNYIVTEQGEEWPRPGEAGTNPRRVPPARED